MELSDILKYKDRFSKNAFMEKISRVAKRAGAKLVYAASSSSIRWRAVRYR